MGYAFKHEGELVKFDDTVIEWKSLPSGDTCGIALDQKRPQIFQEFVWLLHDSTRRISRDREASQLERNILEIMVELATNKQES